MAPRQFKPRCAGKCTSANLNRWYGERVAWILKFIVNHYAYILGYWPRLVNNSMLSTENDNPKGSASPLPAAGYET